MNPPPAEGLASRLFVGPALRTQPDRRLVTLVRDGYESAFEEIVRRYGKPLSRYAAAIVGGRSEEVTQDAFSKALLALRRADGEREIELRPWLYRIVRNTALNDLRDRPPEPAELQEALAGGRSTAEEVERREEVSELLERLRALPEPQRAAIVMRELEGLGHEEIAAALGVSGGAARQAIYRARMALRDGVGLMIPLPLLRVLIDHGAEAGSTAGAGGAIAAGSTIGGAGAGTAIKVGAITAAIVAGGVGTGIAIKEHHHHNPPAETRAAAVRAVEDSGSSTVPGDRSGASAPALSDVNDTSDDPGDGERQGSDNEGGGSEGDSGKNGRATGDGDSGNGQPSGSGQHGSGGGGPGPPPQQEGNGSGPGSGGGQTQGGSGGGGPGPSPGSGNGGGGTSGGGGKGSGDESQSGGGGGPGSGDQGSGGPPPPLPPPTQENGSSGSGSSGSGSSGSSGSSSGGSGSSSGGPGSSSGGDGEGSGSGNP